MEISKEVKLNLNGRASSNKLLLSELRLNNKFTTDEQDNHNCDGVLYIVKNYIYSKLISMSESTEIGANLDFLCFYGRIV